MKSLYLFLLLFIFSGCISFSGSKKPDFLSPSPLNIPVNDISGISSNLQNNVKEIDKLSKGISDKSKKLYSKTQNEDAATIYLDSQKIEYVNKSNDKNIENLDKVKEQIEVASNEVADLKKENEELKNSVTKEYKKIWMIICSIGALIFIASIFISISYSPKIGVPLMIGSIATIAVSYFMAAYAWLIAIIGGVLALGTLGFFIYQAIIERKALKESILTVEATKYKKWNENVRNEVKSLQSDSTQNIVREIKKDIKKNIIKKITIKNSLE